MSDYQIKGVSTNMADSGHDHDIGYKAPKTEVMKSRSGEIRTWSEYINHRLER